LLFVGGSGVLKSIVHDVGGFIKKEMQNDASESGRKLKDLFFLSSNDHLGHFCMSDETNWIASSHKFPSSKWLFIMFGYIKSYIPNHEINVFTDKVIDIYLNANKSKLHKNSGIVTDANDLKVLSLLRTYFDTVPINHTKLYPKTETKRYIVLNKSLNQIVDLPPLPKIYDRHLLVKALMHRECYRGLLKPNHSFAHDLIQFGYDLDPRNYNILKYELSFLDGLGDFYLAREASTLLYRLHEEGRASKMRCQIYQIIKMILSTNTLLSKIAVAYNLHEGLQDPVIMHTIATEYVPCFYSGKINWSEKSIRMFEEEFLADYFEAYVGALFYEQPDVAEKFVEEIYNNLVKTITLILPPDISYDSWTTRIMGRSLYPRPKNRNVSKTDTF
jgi:hypothetical protein